MTDCLISCEEYLAEQNRKVIKIKQNGNCFYCTLSFELFGKQDEDAVVRDVISRMVLLNKNIFQLILFLQQVFTLFTNTVNAIGCQVLGLPWWK